VKSAVAPRGLLIGGATNLVLEASSPFARVLATELILAVAILTVTGFLTSLPPADAIQPMLDGASH
jgi:putative copper export protein